MATTKIEWTDKVWNPLVGCSKVSSKCMNCYAERMARRLKAMGQPQYQDVVDDKGRWTGIIHLVPEKLKDPTRWKKPCRIFVDSMSDLFHPMVPVEYTQMIFKVMAANPQHTYQILTSRPERAALRLQPGDARPNILIGASTGDKADAAWALPYMRLIHTIGYRTFVSFEPALEAIDWTGWEFLNWFICGGENGPKARRMPLDAPYECIGFCHANHIPFFFKGWGATYGHPTNVSEPTGRTILAKTFEQFPPDYFYYPEDNTWRRVSA